MYTVVKHWSCVAKMSTCAGQMSTSTWPVIVGFLLPLLVACAGFRRLETDLTRELDESLLLRFPTDDEWMERYFERGRTTFRDLEKEFGPPASRSDDGRTCVWDVHSLYTEERVTLWLSDDRNRFLLPRVIVWAVEASFDEDRLLQGLMVECSLPDATVLRELEKEFGPHAPRSGNGRTSVWDTVPLPWGGPY